MPNIKTFPMENLSSLPKRLVFLQESGPERKGETPKQGKAEIVGATSQQLETAKLEIAARFKKDFDGEKKGVAAKAIENMQNEEVADRKELLRRLPLSLKEGIITDKQLAILSDPKLEPGLALEILALRNWMKKNLDRQLNNGSLTQDAHKKEMDRFLEEDPVEDYPF